MSEKKSKNNKASGLSREKKTTIISAVVGVIAIGGGWWAYMTFSKVPPPDLNTAKVDEVVGYLGNPNGYARMDVDQREKYLFDAYQRFSTHEDRQAINRRFAQMTDREKTIFMDASFEVAKDRFIEKAREYNKLDRAEKQRYVDKTIAEFEGMRSGLTGGGAAAPVGPTGERVDLSNPFESLTPRTPDEFMVRISKMTTAKEKDEGRQLFEDVVSRSKELDSNPRERERFRSASTR